jgi:PRC-barrel domain
MNEHHTKGAYPSGSSAGSSPGDGRYDRGPGETSRRGEEFLSERTYVPPRHHTIRSREHPGYESNGRGRDWYEKDTVPLLVLGIGGGLLAGWILASASGPKHRRDEWDQRWPDTRPSYGTRGSSDGRSVAIDETRDLIASDKVEGTAVYDRNGERLGSVYNFMVSKRSGQVAYAVMSFGGWLGMGESYHPLPWHTLTYETDRGGYVINLTKERLRSAPSHKAGQDTSSDSSYWRRVKDYWA